jgi:hypothetical protein
VRVVRVPYVVDLDREDRWWWACALPRTADSAYGRGLTLEEAVDGLRTSLEALFSKVAVFGEITVPAVRFAARCSCGFTEMRDEEIGDHLLEVFEPDDLRGGDGLVHEEYDVLACACGQSFAAPGEFDVHLLTAFTPADGVGRDGRRHAREPQPGRPGTPAATLSERQRPSVSQQEKAERWDTLIGILDRGSELKNGTVRQLSALRRAVNLLLAVREELPPPLTSELRSYRATLDGLYLEAASGFEDAEGVLNLLPTYITESAARELCQADSED